MVSDRLLADIPRLSPEWIVSFTIRFISLSPSNKYCSVIQLTQGGSHQNYGDLTPCVYLAPGRNNFSFKSSVNGQNTFEIKTAQGLMIDVPTHIEIHQRYTSGGKYRYFIKINGEEIDSIINNDARQFYNVKVYASNPASWQPACQGYITNLAITNFL